jgi:hypothetical protein
MSPNYSYLMSAAAASRRTIPVATACAEPSDPDTLCTVVADQSNLPDGAS